MGLLDEALFADPNRLANLQLGLGLLGAAGPRGAGVAQAFQGAISSRQQAEQNALKKRLLESQINENDSQAQQRKIQAQREQAAIEQQARIRAGLPSLYRRDPSQAMADGAGAGSVGPTVQNGARMDAQAPRFDVQAAMALGITDPETLTKYAGLADIGLPEVARTIESTDDQGRPVTLQFDKRGRPVGAPQRKWQEPKMLNLGNRQVALDPVTQQILNSMDISQSPDSVASNDTSRRGQDISAQTAREGHGVTLRGQDMTNKVALGNLGVSQGNLALSRDRLAFDRAQPKGQYDSERGGMVDPRSGIFTPVLGQDGMPIGPKSKDLTDSQSKALLFGRRMEASDKIMTELSEKGVDASVPFSRAGYGVGWAVNAVSGAQQQKLDQAKRDFLNAVLRRESGAVITQSEFENGDKQYFPQIGDSAEVKVQKAANRKLAMESIMEEVPQNRRTKTASPDGWSVSRVK